MSLLTQRDPCRLPAWLGRTINMLYRTCRAPVHSITQPRQGTGDWVLPASAQGRASAFIRTCTPQARSAGRAAERGPRPPAAFAVPSYAHVRFRPAQPAGQRSAARGPRRPSPGLHTYVYASGQPSRPGRGPRPPAAFAGPSFTHFRSAANSFPVKNFRPRTSLKPDIGTQGTSMGQVSRVRPTRPWFNRALR